MEGWQDELERTRSKAGKAHMLSTDVTAIGSIKEIHKIWQGSGPGIEPE